MSIAAGVNPHTVKVAAGHGSYRMTMDHYGKVLPGADDEASKRLDAYIERAMLATASSGAE